MNRPLTLILAIFAILTVQLVTAAQEIGTWTTHAVFAAPPQKVIDTGKKIYYTSGNSLFSYDKKADESESLTMTNRLNDSSVSNIFYNRQKGYLLITYASGNLDLLYDDGHTVNISDIKDSSVAPPLTINDVCFTTDGFWLATAFGLVEINDKRYEVVQSGIYNTEVSALTILGDHLVIWADDQVRATPLGSRVQSLNSFTPLYTHNRILQMEPLDEQNMIVRLDSYDYYLARHTVDFSANSLAKWSPFVRHDKRGYLTRTSAGDLTYLADGALWRLDTENLREECLATLPNEGFEGAVGATDSDAAELWTLTREGIACHGFGSDGSLTIRSQRFLPENFSVKEVCWLRPTPDGHSLLAFNIGSSPYRFAYYGLPGRNIAATVATIDMASGRTEDLTPHGVTPVVEQAAGLQRSLGAYVFGPEGAALDPNDPSKLYVCSIVDGIYVMKDGKEIGHYSSSNSPLRFFDGRDIVYHISIDRGGNLWMLTDQATGTTPLHILPAAKLKLDPAAVTASDWYSPDTEAADFGGGQDYVALHLQQSPVTVLADHNPRYHFLAVNNRGTLTNLTDDRLFTVSTMIDQDGNIFAPSYVSAFAEDKAGALWIGTAAGVAVISNPASINDATVNIRRVKVPKNDGTNMADYLLSTDMIMGIAVDAANRKWLATKASGIYLVSADGSEILAHYSTDNSPLPTDEIYTIAADPNSSTIYVGTSEGLLSYASDATPAMDDFSEITVFPNPVKPDYSGPVYIKGLMDGSLVKIADASGHVVYQGRSEGGLLTWDGCNSAGSRLPSGVYYVFASSGANDTKAGGTAKFMIIR